MKKTFTIETIVAVEVDESKFTPAWIQDFSKTFFLCTTVEDHMRNLAMMVANGQIEGFDREFVEGYGPLGDMGIKLEVESIDAFES